MVFFTDPGAVKQIFTGDSDWFRSGQVFTAFEPLLGPNSLPLLDGDRHRRERKPNKRINSSIASAGRRE